MNSYNKLAIAVILMFCLVTVSAELTTWDNWKSWNEDKDTVTVRDLNGNIGTAQIIPCNAWSTIENCVVPIGEDQLVMKFKLWAYEDYNNVISSIKFKDEKDNKKELSKTYEWKYLTTSTIPYQEETANCTAPLECDYTYETKFKNVETWHKITPADLKKNDVLTVGLFTKTNKGDYVDAIPTIYGKEISEWATWTSSLDVALHGYWNFNQTGSTLVDIFGYAFNGTVSGSPNQTAGGINEVGWYFNDNNADYVTLADWDYDTEMAVSVWVYPLTNTAGPRIIGRYGAPTYSWDIWYDANDGNKLYVSYGSAGQAVASNASLTDGAWNHIIINYDGTILEEWLDGTLVLSGAYTVSNNNLGITIANMNDHTKAFKGTIDEIAIWNRSLTTTEITTLYDSGTGTFYSAGSGPGDNPPVVDLNSPANTTNYTVNSVTMNCTVSDDIKLDNVSLVLDGSVTQTNTSGLNASNYIFTEIGLSNKEYTWTCRGVDNSTQSTDGTTRIFNITTNPPTVTQQTPESDINVTINNITFSALVEDEDNISNVSLILDGSYNQTNSTGVNNTNYTFYQVLADGTHIWKIEACDINNQCATTTQAGIGVDTQPPVVTITTPTGFEDYAALGITNEVLNWTVVETATSTCMYSYNGAANVTTSCSGNVSIPVTSVNNNIYLYINDTYNQWGYAYTNWSYKAFEHKKTFNANAISGSIQQYNLTLQTGTGYAVGSAKINYSGTNTSSVVELDGNYTIYNSLATSGSGTKAFMWFITLTDGTKIETTLSNQTITAIKINNCTNMTGNYTLYNFTNVDEALQTQINPTTNNMTAEADVQIYSLGTTNLITNISVLWNKINPFAICLDNNLSGVSLTLDGQIKYDADSYAQEFYNIQGATISNNTLNTNITLYDLDDTSTQEFQITYKDSNLLPVEDAIIQVKRKYISEGVFKVVEIPKTDAQGSTIAHLVLSDVIYTFNVIKDGVVLATFSNVLAVCDNVATGDCTINLNSYGTAITPQDYTTIGDVSFTVGWNKASQEASTQFSVTTGDSSSVSLNVTKFSGDESEQVCSSSIISSGGTLTCNIPATYQNSTLKIEVYDDNRLIGYSLVSNNPDPVDLYGLNLAFIGGIMLLTLLGLGISSNPLLTGMFLILGVGLGIGLNVATGGGLFAAGGTIVWLIIAVVVVLIKGSRRQ